MDEVDDDVYRKREFIGLKHGIGLWPADVRRAMYGLRFFMNNVRYNHNNPVFHLLLPYGKLVNNLRCPAKQSRPYRNEG